MGPATPIVKRINESKKLLRNDWNFRVAADKRLRSFTYGEQDAPLKIQGALDEAVGPLFIELYESERTSAVYGLDRSAEKWLGWPISHYDARTDLDARLNAELENAGFVDKLMNVAIEFTEQFQADSDCFEDAALDRTSAALRREMLDHIESVARFWMATASFANEQWQAELAQNGGCHAADISRPVARFLSGQRSGLLTPFNGRRLVVCDRPALG